MKRVVVTGMGVVTPLGVGVKHVWESLTKGQSGINAISGFDVSDIACRVAGQVPRGDGNGEFNPDNYLDPKEQRRNDDFIIYALAAAEEAIKDSGWQPEEDEELERTGVLVGSGIGGLPNMNDGAVTLQEQGPRRISPFFIPSTLINLAGGQISIKYGYKGPNHAVVTACSTGTHAIGDAARLIQFGDADVMIAGGAEAAVHRLGIAGFAAARALSTSYNDTPTKASRPFDQDRDGFVMGEGAGIVVLEELEHAKKRGATIYAEVAGYGLSGDAHHITSPPPDGNGAFRAMNNALRNAEMDSADIDYVNAHGTSTPVGDGIEASTVKRLLGSAADDTLMSSTKSSIGHLLGAAGAVEAIFGIKSIVEELVPPTLNLDNPSEECLGIDLVPHVAREKSVKTVLSNSFGFGGTNASIILKALK